MNAIKVNEIFHSIQGESLYSGLPCIFIRLSGCNLKCAYCDTRYAWDEGVYMETSDIIDQISNFSCNLVELTGGEPLLQPETPDLIDALLKKSYKVLIETNGSLDIDIADKNCVRIVDIKCPSSLESKKNDLDNLKRLTQKDQIKFVIGDKNDFDYAVNIMSQLKNFPEGNILFSPIPGKVEPGELANWIIKGHHQARLQLQLHKIIWPDIERGV